MNYIHDICNRYNIKNYTINPDGSIDVNGSVNLWYNELTELPLIFNRVTGDFRCSNNRLTSLKGCPIWIGGYFSCANNRLPSLEFSPDYVGDFFSCEYNDLTDNYCETEIDGSFYTNLKQDGLLFYYNKATNYNEWRKIFKRKKILNELYTRHM
jgi:hypothetical protein